MFDKKNRENRIDRYIDIHSHILPQLDDGSDSMEQTRRMLKTACEEGIHTIIATPHYHEGRYMNSPDKIEEVLARVQEEAKDLAVDINLYPGSEIYYSHESIRLLNDKKIPTMAGSRYVLIEFSPMAEYPYIRNGLQELILEGYRPILAHVERYQNVIKDIGRIEDLIDTGVYLQVNALSITGEMGGTSQKTVRNMLKMNYIHFIATDSHSDRIRSPRFNECIRYVRKKSGDAYVNELFHNNQDKLLHNEYI